MEGDLLYGPGLTSEMLPGFATSLWRRA
jgi:hypothetical protein